MNGFNGVKVKKCKIQTFVSHCPLLFAIFATEIGHKYESHYQPLIIYLRDCHTQKYTKDDDVDFSCAIDQQWIFFARRKSSHLVRMYFDWSVFNVRTAHQRWEPYKPHKYREAAQDHEEHDDSANGTDDDNDIHVAFDYVEIREKAIRDVSMVAWTKIFDSVLVNGTHVFQVYDPWACSPSLPAACFRYCHNHPRKPVLRYIGDLSSAFPQDGDISPSDQMFYIGRLKWDTFQEILKIKKDSYSAKVTITVFFFLCHYS